MKNQWKAGRAIVSLAAGAVLCLAAGASAVQGLPGVGAGKCGNGKIDKNEQCDFGNLNGATCESLGNDGGALSCGANCQFDTSQCIPAECGNGVQGPGEECEAGSPAASCSDLGAGFGQAPCGQGCAWDTSQCSAERFADNGDGTVTDFDTGLTWEKKVAGDSSSTDSQGVGNCLHCVGDSYVWASAMSEWISAVNGRTDDKFSPQTGFANHTDWRLPTSMELQTILDCNFVPSCVDPIFGPAAQYSYWSSSTYRSGIDSAWRVNFDPFLAGPWAHSKTEYLFVRAVRGGW